MAYPANSIHRTWLGRCDLSVDLGHWNFNAIDFQGNSLEPPRAMVQLLKAMKNRCSR
jgi:hypothetical protein